MVALLMLYFLIVAVGLIPVNNNFTPADDGVEIMIISNAVHSDIVMPLRNEHFDWWSEFSPNHFAEDTSDATHVAVGWGDAGFYIETPTWNDLKFSTAANALLWPSESCLHAYVIKDEHIRPHAQSIRISADQYQQLVEFIQSTFERDASGSTVTIDVAYGRTDAFFESTGRYHALNTCNSWAGRGLKTAGVRVPWITPLPNTVSLYLPTDE